MIFRRHLAEQIVAGEKTATRRRQSDNPRSPWWRERCAYTPGQVFAVQPGRGVRRVADARVTSVYAQPLKWMSEEDAYAEGFRPAEGLSALAHFRIAWGEINGARDPREIVWVIEFELLAESVPFPATGMA